MTNLRYHKSASKDVRPFFEAATLEEAIAGAQIQLFENQPFTDATSFVIEEQEISRLALVVKPNLSESTLAGGAINRSKLALAVTVVNPFLKKTVLVQKASLAKPAPDEVSIGAEVIESLGGGSNVTVEVALCLATALTKQPGKPFMEGHWLSKKAFDLRPPKPAEDFGVDPMDDAGWKAMGFPPKTLYHVEYFGYVNETANKDRPIAKVYVHSDVYKKLAADNLPKIEPPHDGVLGRRDSLPDPRGQLQRLEGRRCGRTAESVVGLPQAYRQGSSLHTVAAQAASRSAWNAQASGHSPRRPAVGSSNCGGLTSALPSNDNRRRDGILEQQARRHTAGLGSTREESRRRR
jgi:hypothetical protein